MGNSNTYLLTPSVYKRLKKLGFLLVCYGCGEALLMGQTVVSSRGGGIRVKKLYHKSCWENRESNAPTMARNRRLLAIPLGYQPKTATSHIVLKMGMYSPNPHRVLCPSLQNGGSCKKRDRHHEFLRPELLLKHHADPNLQLWECRGCSHFLIRVEKPARVVELGKTKLSYLQLVEENKNSEAFK